VQEGIGSFTLDAVAADLALTKAALYHYFASKDELLFAVMVRHVRAEAAAVRDAIAKASDGAEALRAIVRTPIEHYAGKMHFFRLVYMHAQVFAGSITPPTPEMLEQVRPINTWMYGRAQELLERDRELGLLPDDAEPRRLAFVAHMSSLGLLTMKGMVENAGDPLIHSDEDMIRELERAFTRAARK